MVLYGASQGAAGAGGSRTARLLPVASPAEQAAPMRSGSAALAMAAAAGRLGPHSRRGHFIAAVQAAAGPQLSPISVFITLPCCRQARGPTA